MSVLCTLIEIPEHILDLVETYPEVNHLYRRGLYNREELSIDKIEQLSRQEKEVINEVCKLYPNWRDRLKQNWSINDFQSVLNFKKYHFNDYILIKEKIPEIIESGLNCNFLELGRDWHLVSFLFSGSVDCDRSELAIWNQSCLGINAIDYNDPQNSDKRRR